MSPEEQKAIYTRLNTELFQDEKRKKELQTLEVESFAELMETAIEEPEALISLPFVNAWWEKNRVYIGTIIGDYFKGPCLELNLTFGGKNIMGAKYPLNVVKRSSMYGTFESLLRQTLTFTVPSLWTDCLDKESEGHKAAQEWIKGNAELPDIAQVLARFELAAALFGEDIINESLELVGAMNLEEMRYSAEPDVADTTV
jgi:hypothetical protein